jgi:hypothetical protein
VRRTPNLTARGRSANQPARRPAAGEGGVGLTGTVLEKRWCACRMG